MLTLHRESLPLKLKARLSRHKSLLKNIPPLKTATGW
jgi:hypothetical protein